MDGSRRRMQENGNRSYHDLTDSSISFSNSDQVSRIASRLSFELSWCSWVQMIWNPGAVWILWTNIKPLVHELGNFQGFVCVVDHLSNLSLTVGEIIMIMNRTFNRLTRPRIISLMAFVMVITLDDPCPESCC